MSISLDCSRLTIAATKDVANAGERTNIDGWTRLTWRCLIRSLVATTIQLSNDNWTTARLLNVYRDGSSNGSLHIVTSKHTVEGSVGDIQRHVVMDFRLLSTTVCRFQAWDTSHFQLGSAVHRCTLTTSVGFVHTEVAILLTIQECQGYVTYIA